jgi:hypothetical protein
MSPSGLKGETSACNRSGSWSYVPTKGNTLRCAWASRQDRTSRSSLCYGVRLRQLDVPEPHLLESFASLGIVFVWYISEDFNCNLDEDQSVWKFSTDLTFHMIYLLGFLRVRPTSTVDIWKSTSPERFSFQDNLLSWYSPELLLDNWTVSRCTCRFRTSTCHWLSGWARICLSTDTYSLICFLSQNLGDFDVTPVPWGNAKLSSAPLFLTYLRSFECSSIPFLPFTVIARSASA